METKNIVIILSGLAYVASLSACVPAVATGATTVAVTAAEERTMGDALDDTAIKTRILSNYANKDFEKLFVGIDVSVSEGRVLLTGKVQKPEVGVDAVRLAWLVPGVREVINEVFTADKSGLSDLSRDAFIKSKIRSQYLLDKDIRSINYTIEVVNGIVYIFGIAQSQAEMEKTARIASNTPYVQKVISHTRLKDNPLRKKQ